MASSECGALKEEENDDLAVIVAGDVEGVEPMGTGRQGEGGDSLLGKAALAYATQLGWPVFPCATTGKQPLTARGFKDASKDPTIIKQWWTAWPDANIGIPTGTVSSFDVLDIDLRHGGEESLEEIIKKGHLPDTIEALTGGGGRHIFFLHNPGLRNSVGELPGIDVRGEGGYVIVAPSMHESGNSYEWELSSRPGEVPLGEWPPWLLAHFENTRTGLGGPAKELPNRIVEGERNEKLFSLAGSMRRRGMTANEIALALREVNRGRCSPPLAHKEVDKIATSISRYEPAESPVGEDFVSFVGSPQGNIEKMKWPNPQPLPDPLPPVEPFEIELLPNTLRPWLEDIANRMQTPLDYPAVGALVVLGSIVGRQLAIRPKEYDDWQVVPNLWGVIVGRPSLLKSPALQEILRPLVPMETKAKNEHDMALQDYEAHQLINEAKQKQAKEELRKEVKKGPTGRDPYEMALQALAGTAEVAPGRRRYRTNDVTIEKLGELLKDNARGLLITRDELVGLLKSLDKEGHESDRAFYLEAWNGTGKFVFDRIGRGTVDIEAACVSILGGITPGPLSVYMSRAAKGGADDDGLVQRFQMLVWPDPPAKWADVDTLPNTEDQKRAFEVFARLDRIDPISIETQAPESEAELPFLRFTFEAQQQFREWRNELENRLRSDNLHPMMESHLAKYRSLIPSLALIIHLVDVGHGPVGAEALSRACAWGEYLESHAQRIYAPAVDPAATGAKILGGHIKSEKLGVEFSRRDVQRRGWTGLSTLDEVKSALEVLQELDWVREMHNVGESTAGRPSIRYCVNPKVVAKGR
jgi:hypothetical protein